MSLENPMRRVAHYSFGSPQEVLRAEKDIPLPPLAADKVRVRLTRSMIHPADLQVMAAHYVSSRDDIPEGRVPGMEGVGIVEEASPEALAGTGIDIGTRVAFMGDGTWQTSVDLPARSLVAVPDDITDDVATQMLLNTITALHVLRVAEQTVGKRPTRIVLTAASSHVGKLIAVLALREGLPLICLVRSEDSAKQLTELLPVTDIVSTETNGWQDAVRKAAGDDIPLIIDGVGGKMVTESGWLLNEGGTLISFGLLAKGPADMTMFLPKALTLRGATIGTWHSETSAEDQARDYDTAIDIARTSPKLFDSGSTFDLSDINAAVDAATSPKKQGNVLISF